MRDDEDKTYPNIDLFEFAKTNWLYIDHPVGGRRNIAELFKTPSGIVFFDTWWHNSDGHPVHAVDGQVKHSLIYEFEWWVKFLDGRLARIKKLTPDVEDLWAERQAWEEYKKTDEGKLATRDSAWKILRD